MLGMFSYYEKWIPHYSEKIKPLVVLKKFPPHDEALHALTMLKTDLSSATLGVIDEDLPFILETDASDNAISATLNQQRDHSVAFFLQAFEHLSLDFKGPLPSSTKNRYMPTVIDEVSRFPCSSVDAKTVISCLNRLFALFGMLAYIHSDRGTAFMPHALTSYLHLHIVACSKTSAYNAPANGQLNSITELFGRLFD